MPMYPCNRCLDKNWKFEKPDSETVRATCQGCGYEVEFTPHKGKKKPARFAKPRKPKQARMPYDPPPSSFDPTQIGDGLPPW